MSTILNTNSESIPLPVPTRADFRFHIVVAEWNAEITHALLKGALETFVAAGIQEKNITVNSVPGTVELANAAATIIDRLHPDGVIIIGCVIKGDTPHFDYVCMHTTQAAAILNAKGDTPVTFGVLTVENMQQALDRAGGRLGNKGAEAACAAIEMANLRDNL